jgi:hypothetical protein
MVRGENRPVQTLPARAGADGTNGDRQEGHARKPERSDGEGR